jgi:electron transport complex protein RnfD
METPRFELTASPHIKGPDSTPRIMWTVVGSLVPVILASVWYFGPSAVLVIATTTASCVLTERFLGRGRTLRDGSATITGILLGLTLPAGLPLWMAFIGGVFAVGLGKLIFGGLGQNVFNPALLGRAFMQAAFPQALTTWPDLGGPWWALRGDNFALPFMSPHVVSSMTGATPLGLMKFEGAHTALAKLIFGSTGGSLGETASLVILVCGGYLALKKYLDWRIPISIFITVAVLSQVIHIFMPGKPDALFMLFSGGLMLGAVFMATDMVTSPSTPKGAWIYGVGIGALVVVIRLWGGLPEGVMYSILLMNSLVPFINRATQPRLFGTGKEAAA